MCRCFIAHTWAPTLTCCLCVLGTTHPGFPNWPARTTVLPSTPWTLAEPIQLGLKKGPGERNRQRVCITQLIPLNQWLCQETGSARVPSHSPTPLALTRTCTGKGGGGGCEDGDSWPEPRLEWRRMRATCWVLGQIVVRALWTGIHCSRLLEWEGAGLMCLQQIASSRWWLNSTSSAVWVSHRVRHKRSGHVSVSKAQWKIHTQTTNPYSLTDLQVWHQIDTSIYTHTA